MKPNMEQLIKEEYFQDIRFNIEGRELKESFDYSIGIMNRDYFHAFI